MTAVIAGSASELTPVGWQTRGGHGQLVLSQQPRSVWQHSAMGTGCTTAGARGAWAKLSRRSATNLTGKR